MHACMCARTHAGTWRDRVVAVKIMTLPLPGQPALDEADVARIEKEAAIGLVGAKGKNA